MPLATSESGKKSARQISKVNHARKKAKTSGKTNDENGVDISNLERSFSNQEWRKLLKETRLKIQAKQKEKKEKRGINKATQQNTTEAQEESAQPGNGGQFGLGAYRNEKEGKYGRKGE